MLLSGTTLFAQQIGNSDFEQWEPVSSGEEPVNWNSFLTAGGSLSWAASDQMSSSIDVRPGTAGTKSCKIWAKSTFGIIANGLVTLGKINMGSTTANDPSNYNYTVTGDPDFSESLTVVPDSIVFWAKSNCVGDAQMKASVHEDMNYRDPEDAASTAALVAVAEISFPNTNGNWQRFSVPFTAGVAQTPAYILVSFTTNNIPGSGSGNDELYIDDIELVYNSTSSVDQIEDNKVSLSYRFAEESIHIISEENLTGNYRIYNIQGQLVQKGEIDENIPFSNHKEGVYFVILSTNKGNYSLKFRK